MSINTGPYGYRDVHLVVGGSGAATSDLQLANKIVNFSFKCSDTATYKYDFLDEDDFPIYGGGTDAPGPLAGPVGYAHMKCKNFRVRLTGAAPGSYDVRVYVE